MKKFKEITLDYTLVDKNNKNIIKSFIEASKLLYVLNEVEEEKKIKEIYKKLLSYSNFTFVKKITNQIETALNKLQDKNSDTIKSSVFNLCKSIENKTKNLSVFLVKGDFKSGNRITTEVEFSTLQKLIVSSKAIIKSEVKIDFLKNSMASIFSAGVKTGLLDSFDRKDWQKLNSFILEDDKIYFNYLPNISLNNSFEEYVYYIQNLKTEEATNINLSREEFKDYLKIIYKEDPFFKKFKTFVDSYLHSNNKKIIPTILTFLNKFPVIKNENEERKKEIKVVYRGVKINSESNPELYRALLNKKSVDYDFVATSLNKSTAKDFAVGLGGSLMKPDREGDRKGLLLTYAVNENSIVIDFNILGSIFGEGEVYINTKKSKLVHVEPVIY